MIPHLAMKVVVAATMLATNLAFAQDSRTGWLEGTVRDESGKPWNGSMGVRVITQEGRNGDMVLPDQGAGGLYAIRNLEPGTYEVRLQRNIDTTQATQRVFGVVIGPGQRTVLNFVTRRGDDILEIGKPAVVTQSAVVLVQELKRLQDEIDQLKRELAVLKKINE